jgi:predicted amino acid-binding ACT domain protein
MRELLWERKQVVELLNFCNPRHTPLFFEQEPWVDDPAGAKAIMDNMLDHSDAFLQIHYLTCGEPKGLYGDETPIQYEFKRFLATRGSPCILLRKRPDTDAHIANRLVNLQQELARHGVQAVEFTEAHELADTLNAALRGLDLAPDPPEDHESLVLRYTGRDFTGLLEAITSTLFHSFRLNVTYMSYAATGDWGTLLLTCAPRERLSKPIAAYAAEVEDAVGQEIVRVRPAGIDEKHLDLFVSAAGRLQGLSVTQHEKPTCRRAECYIEVRHADLPGEVAAICGTIKKPGVNIDELQLHATDPGLDRERLLRLWVSHTSAENGSCTSGGLLSPDQSLLLQLEASLLRLVGVRSVEVRHLTRGA